jgi:hypothetical protein
MLVIEVVLLDLAVEPLLRCGAHRHVRFQIGSLAVIAPESQVRRRLAAGGKWIRTFGSAILIVLLKTALSETDQCTTEQGVGRVPAYPAL